jgi:hypothetical protein
MRGLFVQIFTAVSVAGAAEAAPWVREDGGWYARTLVAHDTLDGAEGWRGDVYGEYGLNDRWTLTAKAEAVTYPDFEAFDREAYRLTLRRKVLDYGKWTVGVEAGPVFGSTATGFAGCKGLGFETRGGLGYSGQTKQGRSIYAFADAAYIRQEDGCERTRAEIGYGSDLSDRIFLTQQLWIEQGNQSANSLKTENQIGVHFDKFDLSFGYREELGGEFEETAVLVALVARR